ncbi:MAG TPA: ATP-binding protein [bacterium]|nr:ATP-binding protein [bacterium]
MARHPMRGKITAPMDKVTLELTADAKELPPFRNRLQTWLKEAGYPQKLSGEILVAVQEALTNIIRHAYGGKQGKIGISYEDDGERVEIILRDQGQPFDAEKIPPPELPPKKAGGLGLHLIKTLMDQVEYDADREGNVIRMVKFKKGKESTEKP